MARLIVTLDGPAGVGKSTLARLVAGRLGVAYLDTGAMYRAVALTLGEGAWERSEPVLRPALATLRFSLHGSGEDTELAVNGRVLGEEIRTEQVAMWGSNVARLPVVRQALTEAQRDLGRVTSLVAEGRDMGTVVFPGAAHKFFLDADPAERARRRWLQLRQRGVETDVTELESQIRRRDEQDRNRAVAPLKPADDALIIDTTRLSVLDVLGLILDRIEGKTGEDS